MAHHLGNKEWAYAGNSRGSLDMTHSKLSIEVQGTHILVVLRGTCFRAKYRKQEAPWLATAELGPDDPEAPMTLSEFRSLAWAAERRLAVLDGSRITTNCTRQRNGPRGEPRLFATVYRVAIPLAGVASFQPLNRHLLARIGVVRQPF
jgi:hypothetical protein